MASELPYQQTEGGLWGDLEGTLTDLHFVEAKCAAGMTYDLITDYVRAREVLPGTREEARRDRERADVAQRYGAELIEYAEACSERRRWEQVWETRTTADEPASGSFGIATQLRDRFARRPQNADSDQKVRDTPVLSSLPNPSLPIPPSPIASDRQDDQNRVEGGLAVSPHIRVSIFHQFLDAHAHLFAKFADLDSFCIQNAYNYADAGPVTEQATRIITTERGAALWLLRINRPPFHFKPCLKTLEGHTGSVQAVSITPDAGRRCLGAIKPSGYGTLRRGSVCGCLNIPGVFI